MISPSMVRATPISIHAPHTGRDKSAWLLASSVPVFQSTRPIRGATIPKVVHTAPPIMSFQSTRPIRGATIRRCFCKSPSRFQSTRPIRGATSVTWSKLVPLGFQSTRPIRGATSRQTIYNEIRRGDFNPRAPYGARHLLSAHALCESQFQSTRPIRGATSENGYVLGGCHGFQSTRPIRGAT